MAITNSAIRTNIAMMMPMIIVFLELLLRLPQFASSLPFRQVHRYSKSSQICVSESQLG